MFFFLQDAIEALRERGDQALELLKASWVS